MRSCHSVSLSGDSPEQHGFCGQSSCSCTDLHVRVHLRAAGHFRGSMGTTGRGCSRLQSFPIWQSFCQERSVVIRHWKGMVLMSLSLFLHTSQIFLELDFGMQDLFTDCSTCWITVQKMFTWLSFFPTACFNLFAQQAWRFSCKLMYATSHLWDCLSLLS